MNPNGHPPARRLFEMDDVIATLKIKRTKVYEEMKLGRLRSVKVGSRRLFTDNDLDAYIELLRAEAGAEVKAS